MARRNYRDIFLDKLTELSGKGESLVRNKRLREALAWDEERYKRVKAQLQDEGLVIVGRGWGGLVGLADSPEGKGLSVFISYSHVDEKLKTELVKHLEPLRRLGWIETWHDQMIKPGDEWEHEISSNLKSAALILLLVSIDFINSKYCYDIEMETALERHANGGAKVVPIILRNCLWHHAPFSKLQALPKDAKAIVAWPDQDEGFTSVAAGIRQIVEAIRADNDE